MSPKQTVRICRVLSAFNTPVGWHIDRVFTQHSLGGVPGNRTAPIVGSIAAACGLTMPVISEASVAYPSSTLEAMQCLTKVAMPRSRMQRIVGEQGGCFVDGKAVSLSLSNTQVLQVERTFNACWEMHLCALVLSRAITSGSTHAWIEIPVGPVARVTDESVALRISELLSATGGEFGISVKTCLTDGSQPVGNGIGPRMEARDILAVLRGEPGAPADLHLRAVGQVGQVLEFAGISQPGEGVVLAQRVLDEGLAWQKFQQICDAQGGLRMPAGGGEEFKFMAHRAGQVVALRSPQLARLAMLAGAPAQPGSGVDLHVKCGQQVQKGQPLLTIHAGTRGNLEQSRAYLALTEAVVRIEAGPGQPEGDSEPWKRGNFNAETRSIKEASNGC